MDDNEKFKSKLNIEENKGHRSHNLSLYVSKRFSTLKTPSNHNMSSTSKDLTAKKEKTTHNRNVIKDFNERCREKQQDKEIKAGMARIEQHVYSKRLCTFSPQIIESCDYKLNSSFVERQANSMHKKQSSIEDQKYLRSLKEKNEMTFRPNILVASQTLKNYIPVQQRIPLKKETPAKILSSRNPLSKSNSSCNLLYEDAKRRATNKCINHHYHSNSFCSPSINANTHKIYYDKIKKEIDGIVFKRIANIVQINFQQCKDIAMELGCNNMFDQLWNLSLCQKVCIPTNLKLLLYVIFGIVKVDLGWSTNCRIKSSCIGYEEGANLHFSKADIRQIFNKFSHMRQHHLNKQKEATASKPTHSHKLSINIRSRSLASERIKREGKCSTLYEKFMSQQQKKNEMLLNTQFKYQEQSFNDIRDRPLVNAKNVKKGTSLRDLCAPKCKTIDLTTQVDPEPEEVNTFIPNISRLENLIVINPTDKSISKDIQRIRKAHESSNKIKESMKKGISISILDPS